MVRKIVKLIPPEELQADLEMFRQKALDLGSADAKIITSGQVIIDERVRAKCMNPKCITNFEQVTTRFRVVSKKNVALKCHYCEKITNQENLQII